MIPSTPSFSALTGVHSMNELFPLERAAEGYERIHERVGDYLPRNAELVLEPAALLGRGVAALGHATCRGAAVPCTPASGRHRLLGRRWSAGSISRVTGKGT